MKNNNYEEIKITINDYIDIIYNYMLINSLVFTNNFDCNLIKILMNYNLKPSQLLNLISTYLQINKDSKIFDNNIKNNVYNLIGYIASLDDEIKPLEKNKMLNNMKILVNNMDNNNYDFIRSQILLRDYGNFNYKWNYHKLKRIPDYYLDELKNVYYNSIENDFNMLNFLLLDNEQFYNKKYELNLGYKQFYRSMNVFINNNSVLFYKDDDAINKIKFMMEKDINIILNDAYNSVFSEDYNNEFLDIIFVTEKLVKKLDRKLR